MTISPVSTLPPAPALEAYTEAAQKAQDLYVNIDNTQYQVLSWGQTPMGRSVAWIAPDVDTTSMFTQALAQTFGRGIASAVANQLGLDPAPGKPLSSRTVMSALDMADQARNAMTGVDFLSRLSTSALANTPIFKQACKDNGVDPTVITAAQRQDIDVAMQAQFEHASTQGLSPVSLETAGKWLRELIKPYASH
jgi:hypothetical protein